MKRIIAAIFIMLFMAPAPALADFYVIAGGGLPAGTEIKSLPAVISSSGFYFIKKDLTCGAGAHGITITADHVTLDLMGFSLIGPGGSGSYDGVYMNGRTNVEIRNGTIRDFNRYGIFEESNSALGHRVMNVRVTGNDSFGMRIRGNNLIVSGCSASSNGQVGIAIANGTVKENLCSQNGGSGVYAGLGSSITGNTCYQNGTNGIEPQGDCLVMGNTAVGNTGSNILNVGSCTYVNNHAP